MTNSEVVSNLKAMLNEEVLDISKCEQSISLCENALEENTKLKAEIERIKNESHRRSDMFLQEIKQLKWKLSSVETQRDLKGYDAKRNADIMSSQLKIIEQLKSELEQLSKQYSNVESLYHKYYNLHKKGQV